MNKIFARSFAVLTMLAPAVVTVVVTIEAIRIGRFTLGTSGVADAIPTDFYASASFLPAGVLDNAGWIIAVCIVWIVVAALVLGRNAFERSRDSETTTV